MDEDTAARQQSHGRTVNVTVYGDTADEIELAALDEARRVFSGDIALEIVRDYKIFSVGNGPLRMPAGDKSYYATVVVRERAES